MSEELIIFTHNDLDMMGCMLNINHALNVKKKYFYTNYVNIPEIVGNIEAHILANQNTHMIITDVSFSDNKDYLKQLYDTGINITYIDHHLYPDNFFDAFPNMSVHWDDTKSATMLCYEFFRNDNPNLLKLSTLIDVYDLWQVDSPYFDISQLLNAYYWNYDVVELANSIKELDYNLPPDFASVTNEIKDKWDTAIQQYESSGRLLRAEGITFAFIDGEFFNPVLINEMRNGQDAVIGIADTGIVRVRINKDADITNEKKDEIRNALTGTKDIGHMNAFTYKMEHAVNSDTKINEAKKIIGEFQ